MKSPKLRLMMKAKKKPDAKKPMTVEGSAARPRLDRPGRMNRAEGGPTLSPEAKRGVTENELKEFGKNIVGGALAGFGGATMVGRGLKGVMKGLPISAASVPVFGSARRSGEEAKRIEKGQAEPGKEDRAKGGKVGK